MDAEGSTLRCGIPADKASREEACPGNLGNCRKGRYKRRGRSSAHRGELDPTLTTDIGDQRPRNREAQPIQNQQQNRRMCAETCDNTIKGTLDR
jgi:hypothetical protein